MAEADVSQTFDFNPPPALLDIADRLSDAGHDVWAVGGAVRDSVLGVDSTDWDLATDARPEHVRGLFRRTVPVGIEHGTVGVFGRDRVLYEVTTFRRDVETHGRRAVVAFADTIEEDLARRDFTINAIAWHPLRRELRDPWGGIEDLRAGVLRTVGDPKQRFAEDYLRVLRALRFAGHYELRIEEATWQALREAVDGLPALSAERIREELWKVLVLTRAASRTLGLYEASGALAKLFPELQATVGLELGVGDVWQLTMRTVDALARRHLLVRVAALLHATGYPAAKVRDLRGGFRYTGHERWAARRADAVLKRLKSSNADRARVVALVGFQSDLFPPDSPDSGIRRWLQHVPPELVRDLFRLRIALCRAASNGCDGADLVERWRRVHAVLLSRPVLTVAGLAIGGRELQELGMEPGPAFGRILDDLLQRVVEDPSLNVRERLIELVQEESV